MTSGNRSGVPTVGVVGCAAGGLEDLRVGLVEPLLAAGYRLAVTLTPRAAEWLAAAGESERLSVATGLPVRVDPRLPREERPHPPVSAWVVAPATANTVAKLALGVSDNQALTQVNESLTTVPVVVFPRVNAAHARHPAWSRHLEALQSAGVHVVYGEDVWPLHEPRSAPGRGLPWDEIIRVVRMVVPLL